MIKHVKQAKASMMSYSNCLRCTGVLGFTFLALLTGFQALIVVPNFPSLSEDLTWVHTGNPRLDEFLTKMLQSNESYYIGNETVVSNYQATIDNGQPPYNFIDYTDAQTSFHVFLQLLTQVLILLAFVYICLAGQVSATMLAQDKIRAEAVQGASNLEDMENENRPINPAAAESRNRQKLARLPASTIYHQNNLLSLRNLFLIFMALAILVELLRWRTVYDAMQTELELRYEDEYYIWRDVFVNGVDPEKALEDNAERKANPDNQYGNP